MIIFNYSESLDTINFIKIIINLYHNSIYILCVCVCVIRI